MLTITSFIPKTGAKNAARLLGGVYILSKKMYYRFEHGFYRCESLTIFVHKKVLGGFSNIIFGQRNNYLIKVIFDAF